MPHPIIGRKFFHLTVLERFVPSLGSPWVKCACVCGAYLEVHEGRLWSGAKKSCGCISTTKAIRIRKPKGERVKRIKRIKDPLLAVWREMLSRCYSPKNKSWRYYGGCGIGVCERWHNFQDFRSDIGDRPSKTHSIDRYPDPSGNYEPENFRWATPDQQTKNRRTREQILKMQESYRLRRS